MFKTLVTNVQNSKENNLRNNLSKQLLETLYDLGDVTGNITIKKQDGCSLLISIPDTEADTKEDIGRKNYAADDNG